MKQRVLMFMFVSLLLVGLAGFSGCSSSDDDPDPLNVSGTWVIVMQGFPNMTAVLTHTGTAITGTVSDSDNYSQVIAGTTVASAGTKEPRTVTLVINFSDGQIATLTGSVSDNNKSMSGTYTDNFGGSDSWSAALQ